MTEGGVEIREPISVKPSKIVYAPDTLRGKINQIASKIREGVNFYFRGANPQVPTRPESEKK